MKKAAEELPLITGRAVKKRDAPKCSKILGASPKLEEAGLMMQCQLAVTEPLPGLLDQNLSRTKLFFTF